MAIKGKTFVGLSGGVDSAVSAALLKQQGYDVTGVFIRIAIPGYPCTAGADKIDAMRVAAHLRIPFIEVDLSEEYKKRVFDISVQEFARGRTPNPDALCNREIKFGLFYEFARSREAEWVATGHYAQIKDGKLYASLDKEKDQSYFLWAVPETVLRHTLFPVGHLEKSHVRSLALEFGLPNAARKDSQGLCFLGPISLEEMIEREVAPMPGIVTLPSGKVVGQHEGVAHYTLGQRHGFTLATQDSHEEPHYVIAKDVEHNTLVVSDDRYPTAETQTEIELTETNWIGVAENGKCFARFRYRQPLIAAHLDAKNNTVTLGKPHYVPEGQSLVLYRGERCLGGGVIEKSRLH